MKKDSKKGKVVFVGLSGGVDSSVAAALLKAEGHTVVGVFIRTWQPDFIECSFREDRLDAMRVAAHLDIPFLECDAEREYKQAVADYMIESYSAGRTPNPDVFCNREIKFGVFWNFAKAHGADAIATGHYARIEDGTFKKAVDPSKDQAYFLWTLTQEDISHVMFPLGALHKTAVRKLATKYGLPTANKKDSQGICMLGDLDLKKFLEHYIPSKRGDVLNDEGQVIGYHDGAVFLTLGERHGFMVTKKTPHDAPYYIIARDIEQNTITVAHNVEAATTEARTEFLLERTNWIKKPEAGKIYAAQVRYHGTLLPCRYKEDIIIFDAPVLAAVGQSIVLYDGDICMGGGILK